MSTLVLAANEIFSAFFNMTREDQERWITVFTWSAALYVAATLSALGYLTIELNTANEKITRLEVTRFDAHDAEKLKDSINGLTLSIAKLPTENPPHWFIDEVNELRKKIEGIEKQRR